MSLFILMVPISHSWDATYYEINIRIFPEGDSLAGAGEAWGVLVSDVPRVDLHLGQELAVDSVALFGPSGWSRSGDTLWLDVSSLSPGDSFGVRVFYHGVPALPVLWFTPKGVFSSSLGDTFTQGAHHWFPCYDHPGDKVDSARLAVEVPEGWLVGGNGVLEGVDTLADGWLRFRWYEGHPIGVYLIAFCASDDYAHWTDAWGGIPLWFYAYSADSGDLAGDLSLLPDMLYLADSLFGPYPYSDEKFGYAEATIWGGGACMENQTLVFMSPLTITGSGTYSATYFHEMTHQWFGDWVTVQDWRHVWLSEGFASYGEVLWTEYHYGPSMARATLVSFANQYFAEDASHPYPIYDPDVLWGTTVYKKGAWVLHMLRFLLGDSAFFEVLRAYLAAYGGSNATIPEFRAVAEAAYGQSLDWFFSQWIYDVGYPVLEWSWELRGDTTLVSISQVQDHGPVFIFPLEVLLASGPDTLLDTLWVDEAQEELRILAGFAPDTVVLDPNLWLLKKLERVGVGEGAPGAGFRVWAFAGRLLWRAPKGSLLSLYDVSGRLVWRRRLDGDGEASLGLPPGVYRAVLGWEGGQWKGSLLVR